MSIESRRMFQVDESTISDNPEKMQLMLVAGRQQVSYCIVDPEEQKYLGVADYQTPPGIPEVSPYEWLKGILKDDPLLNIRQYKRVICAVHSVNSTLLPSHLTGPDSNREVLNRTGPVNEQERIFTDSLKMADIRHVYTVPEELVQSLGQQFDGAMLYHAGTALIESQLLHNKNNTDPEVLVSVRKGEMDIVVTRGRQLLLYNTFPFQSGEEFVYYLLFVSEQLGLNPEEVRVRLAGDIDKQSAAYILTSKYIRNFGFAERPDAYRPSFTLQNLPGHAFYHLFVQYLCV